MRKRSILACLSGLAIFPFAPLLFGAQKIPDFPLQPAGKCAIVVRQDDVTIGLQPVETEQDQLTYFNVSLSKQGFFPVFVVIHNRSKDDSLLLDTSEISYGSANTGPAENTPEQKMGMTGLSVFPIFGPLMATTMAQDLSEIKHNLILKGLQTGTLSPGETMHGFLYISIPKKGPHPKLEIHFPISWSSSDKTPTLNLTIPGETK